MQRFIFISLISFLSLSGFSQKPKVLNQPTHDDRALHFGFCLGLNTMDFIIHNTSNAFNDTIADVTKLVPGFHVQIVSNFRLAQNLDVRFLPGISFGQRDLNFFVKDKLVNSNHKLESNFLEFPILLKYKSNRINNFRPYVVTGPNVRVDLAKTYSEDDHIYLALKRLDIYSDVGVGIDFYLPYFKFTTELRYSYGFRNVLKRKETTHPEYQNSIDRLNSSIFLLSFYFE